MTGVLISSVTHGVTNPRNHSGSGISLSSIRLTEFSALCCVGSLTGRIATTMTTNTIAFTKSECFYYYYHHKYYFY